MQKMMNQITEERRAKESTDMKTILQQLPVQSESTNPMDNYIKPIHNTMDKRNALGQNDTIGAGSNTKQISPNGSSVDYVDYREPPDFRGPNF